VPLGARWDGRGTNFAVFSASARQVSLCLFDDGEREQRIPLTEVDAFVWHGYVPGAGPGTRYGFRTGDPAHPDANWRPADGVRSNPAKLLIDPYALAVDGPLDWGSSDADAEELFDYRWADGSRNDTDSAARVPRAVVVDPAFDWGDEQRPARSLANTIIYETHVRAMTINHPDVPSNERGTYKGMAHPAVISYLRDLGITAVELMPVQQFFANRGAVNFWGYDPICFLAPHGAYSAAGYAGQQVREFQEMVRSLHQGGLEVILDVVFNHTFEGGGPPPGSSTPSWHVGPSVSLRGLDNGSYYILSPASQDGQVPYYVNETGTGNTVNIWDPAALRLIMDGLRHWAEVMHVDGFRFDLGAVLAQTDDQHPISVFLDLVAQDPVLNKLKLIAEPWFGDRHPQMLGRFPPLWSQWNGNFHWDMRDFWKTTGNTRAITNGLLGSPEIFNAADGERPTASINYAACHDGLNLRDSVSYTDQGQHSWDCRNPGQSDDDPEVRTLRARMARNLLATAVLAQGVPMIFYGDECGRTQDGNANAYDIDGPSTYMTWGDLQDSRLLDFARRVIVLRRDHPVFRHRRFLQAGGGVSFYRPDGSEVSDSGIDQTNPGTVAIFLDGTAIPDPGPDGTPVRDTRSFLLILNADWRQTDFVIPGALPGDWRAELVTEAADGGAGPGLPLTRPGRSMLVLSRATATD